MIFAVEYFTACVLMQKSVINWSIKATAVMTINAAIADKPRDAFAQYALAYSWNLKTYASPHRIWSFYVKGCDEQLNFCGTPKIGRVLPPLRTLACLIPYRHALPWVRLLSLIVIGPSIYVWISTDKKNYALRISQTSRSLKLTLIDWIPMVSYLPSMSAMDLPYIPFPRYWYIGRILRIFSERSHRGGALGIV